MIFFWCIIGCLAALHANSTSPPSCDDQNVTRYCQGSWGAKSPPIKDQWARGSAFKRHIDRLLAEGLSSLLAIDKEAWAPCHTGLSVGLFECPYNVAEGMVQGRAWKKLWCLLWPSFLRHTPSLPQYSPRNTFEVPKGSLLKQCPYHKNGQEVIMR